MCAVGLRGAGGRLSVWQRIDARVAVLRIRHAGAVARDRELAELLRGIAAAARTGATLPQALDHAARRGSGPGAAAVRETAARIALGAPVEDALARLADRLDAPAARLFAQVVSVQHRRGGDLADPCHRLAALLHDRCRLDAEARSATAQARFSSRAVLAIPAVLVVFASWRAPDTVRAMLTPGMLLLALPGMLLILAGTIVATRIARRAVEAGGGEVRIGATGTSRLRTLMLRVAGKGPKSRRGARLAGAAVLVAGPILALGSGRLGWIATAGLVLAAVAWPWSDAARRRRADARIAASGVEGLLEVSIALFAAGATAHEVATMAPASCPPALRAALAPAVHGVGLGRSIPSAFRDLSVLEASPILDAWLHAVCASAELGAQSVPVLDQLLRDARAARREQLRSSAATAAPRMQLALVLLVVPGVMWIMLLATVGGLVEQLRAAGVA